MRSPKILQTVLLLCVLCCNIGCDQVSKSVARLNIGTNEQIGYLGGHFTLMRVENSGAFLSVGDDWPPPVRSFALVFVPTLVLLLTGVYLLERKQQPMLVRIGGMFVLGGGAGNLYDRIMFGSVTDFMHIDFMVFTTGVFNMADVSIMTGVAVLCIALLWRRSEGHASSLTENTPS